MYIGGFFGSSWYGCSLCNLTEYNGIKQLSDAIAIETRSAAIEGYALLSDRLLLLIRRIVIIIILFLAYGFYKSVIAIFL